MQSGNEGYDPTRDIEGVPQADPQLQEGRVGGLRIAVVMLGLALLVGFVLYGVNQEASETQTAATPPATSQTTGAAPQSGGNVAGGENRAAEPQAEAQKPQQPVPEPAKPTTDSSQR